MTENEEQLEQVLTSARRLKGGPLSRRNVAYAVMLLIFAADSRASRQMASEYGRAARTLVDEGATDAAVAFERLEAEGIKRLARPTAVRKTATKSDQVRRTLISSSERAKRLSAVPAGQHIRITVQVMAAPKGRPALRLVRVHSVVPAPTGPTLSDKPTVTSDKQIRKVAPKWMPGTPGKAPTVTLRRKPGPALKPGSQAARPKPPRPTTPWGHK